ncbi:MAG: hypothetical protein ABW157_21500 [Candidatus Thiodiazotropha sp. LLP2]
MNGKKREEIELDKIIDQEKQQRDIYESYEPTRDELDDQDPPSEDSQSDGD